MGRDKLAAVSFQKKNPKDVWNMEKQVSWIYNCIYFLDLSIS